MDDQRIGRTIVVLRQRRGWRQVDLGARSGLSQSAISDMERGRIERFRLSAVRRVLRSLGASASLDVIWGGRGDLDRLLDADHARLVEIWTKRHADHGWQVWNEASYSIFGERGRIDLLAYHPSTGSLEVAECKTGIWNAQDTAGRLDAKVRLAPKVAAQRGWVVRRVVAALIVAEGTTARRRIREHEMLFRRFELRGRAATSFVREPGGAASGLLAWVSLPPTKHGRLRRAGQRRVRVVRASQSVDGRDALAAAPAVLVPDKSNA